MTQVATETIESLNQRISDLEQSIKSYELENKTLQDEKSDLEIELRNTQIELATACNGTLDLMGETIDYRYQNLKQDELMQALQKTLNYLGVNQSIHLLNQNA